MSRFPFGRFSCMFGRITGGTRWNQVRRPICASATQRNFVVNCCGFFGELPRTIETFPTKVFTSCSPLLWTTISLCIFLSSTFFMAIQFPNNSHFIWIIQTPLFQTVQTLWVLIQILFLRFFSPPVFATTKIALPIFLAVSIFSFILKSFHSIFQIRLFVKLFNPLGMFLCPFLSSSSTFRERIRLSNLFRMSLSITFRKIARFFRILGTPFSSVELSVFFSFLGVRVWHRPQYNIGFE